MNTLALPDQYPDILADFAGLALQRIQTQLPLAQAQVLAFDLAEDVRQKWSGCQIYIPKSCERFRNDRNAAIWRDFNGHNQTVLARRYGLSLQTIYDILAKERLARQPDLFR